MTASSPASSAPFSCHDHQRCQSEAMAAAERICAARGARMTPVRRRVLELLWESHRPLGAYALLERLKEDGLGSQPPVIYRALDFLIAHGLAHKLERLNSYVGCVSAGECEAPHFLICSSCKLVAEIHSGALEREIAAETARRGFEMARNFVEVQGLCPACQKGGAAAEREAAEA